MTGTLRFDRPVSREERTIVKASTFIPSIVAILSFQAFSSFSSASPKTATTGNANVRSAGKSEGGSGCWNIISKPTASTARSSTPTGTCLPSWAVVDSPNANENMNDLGAVTGSGNDVWAVGEYDLFGTGDFRTLTIHWDGSAWSLIPSPNPGDFRDYLFGATGSGNDVWAVGMYNNHGDQPSRTLMPHRNRWRNVQPDGVPPGGPGMTLTLHWNGSAWSRVTSPNAGTSGNLLWGATGSGNDVWAAGEYSNGQFTPGQTLTLHWNGSAWAIVASPRAGLGVSGAP